MQYNAGRTTSVSYVEEMIPPITTVASGRWTSAPTPTLTAIGRKPGLAISAVISTGRSRALEDRAFERLALRSQVPNEGQHHDTVQDGGAG
jgi:hypothetical protein